jgi:hypothetical protein
MVSNALSVKTPKFNRQLYRTVQKHKIDVFEGVFGHPRNSPYEARHFFELYWTAAKNRRDGMANEASRILNLQARRNGAKPLYRRGPRIRCDGTYSDSNDFNPEKFYPASKTMLNRVKKTFEIKQGSLTLASGTQRRINPLDRGNKAILKRAKSFVNPLDELTGMTVAIDFHDQDFYGKHDRKFYERRNTGLTITRGKNTKFVYCFCSSRFLSTHGEFCTPPLLISSPSQAIEEIHKQYQQMGMEVRTFLGDKSFCGVKQIKTFQHLHLDYLTPLHRGKIDAFMESIIANASKEHVTLVPLYMGKKEKEPARTLIVIVPSILTHPSADENTEEYEQNTKDREPMVFSTSMKPETDSVEDKDSFGIKLAQIYRSRFGIESAWAQLKSFRPLTTSPNPVVRLFYFYMGIILYNIWILARGTLKMLTKMEFFRFYMPLTEPLKESLFSSMPSG